MILIKNKTPDDSGVAYIRYPLGYCGPLGRVVSPIIFIISPFANIGNFVFLPLLTNPYTIVSIIAPIFTTIPLRAGLTTPHLSTREPVTLSVFDTLSPRKPTGDSDGCGDVLSVAHALLYLILTLFFYCNMVKNPSIDDIMWHGKDLQAW